MLDCLEHYVPTRLEERLLRFYKEHGIYTPQDIDLGLFLSNACIRVYYLPKPSAYFRFRGDKYTIVVDKRLPRRQQRVELAHELGHVLLHVGHQAFMPADERERQEYQADMFAMYALAPTFMIADCIEPADSRKRLVADLAAKFDVPETFMDARLDLLEEHLNALAFERYWEQAVAEQRATYDYTYRHPLNHRIEYLVKDGVVIGRRRRADI
ncbi:ImmA/IrrE family metallo-endopeptidase [Alicyclobacillus kakegawensis]|uniref:ImmA/IrrE family metallo-endopeptidase n=1 Tax=Alicyclobacillus kakegawensis TaxID=392012 RepID=UPI00083779CB|nr:ImmA/IrrE family metallo-endopeptidase [Alicyclobacillus kakegawensis]